MILETYPAPQTQTGIQRVLHLRARGEDTVWPDTLEPNRVASPGANFTEMRGRAEEDWVNLPAQLKTIVCVVCVCV